MNSLENKIEIIERKLLVDNRGWFLKIIDGKENHIPKMTGEIYFTSAKPNESKGGHYHNIANEWFTLISGEAILVLEDVRNNDKMTIKLNMNCPKTVFIPSYIAHQIYNTGDTDYILCAYTDLLYDPKDTIIYNVNI